jgi:putative IMPACT (imprinted ancient) family translation regulator
VIEAADIYPYIEMTTVNLTLDYKQIQPLEYALKKLDGQILKQDFAEQVRVVVQLPAEQVAILLQSFADNY